MTSKKSETDHNVSKRTSNKSENMLDGQIFTKSHPPHYRAGTLPLEASSWSGARDAEFPALDLARPGLRKAG